MIGEPYLHNFAEPITYYSSNNPRIKAIELFSWWHEHKGNFGLQPWPVIIYSKPTANNRLMIEEVELW